ncbi:hypothetical protein ACHRVW_05860 [Flavobacterium collinsii]|jgi:hypothetical protein|uniref:DUF5362 domain-containing protein n=1 Tax=Flavobacterium collinsii TaxID=1114861 RepID=A0A9W4TEA4_9FLAO|nr:hypothetical protein [Flavobacterium collinsii]GIQ58519.1 hypothetical protein Flavo103_16550 [Flavobacterium collinsii]CAA9202854.1 hypothetical protein FLACOL7796_04499 [Flavobacterium collinsii]CAI2765351.1 conserved membrane protein of unknown function [Flavobacterium collinsii]
MEETSVFEKFELQLDQTAKDFLKETAKWAYFLSILGFIGIGLIIVIAVFAGTIFSVMGNSMPGMGGFGNSFGVFMGFLYVFIAAIYFFPVYYLYKFAATTKRAFRDNDSELLTNSLGYLKSHYKFIGVLMLAIFALYGLLFVFGILGALLGR